ncbi:hypothetical protein LR48_Vigan01g208200 [Vigna angularis]|uniref:Uncharacterized protein n=1 Tax=Phaseolus angularis TaxID=3914 RepID=A0A0L9TPX6_PHAAN|nr:hypothetical protein LR48_Vigan01g208200 [Vigna angularis]
MANGRLERTLNNERSLGKDGERTLNNERSLWGDSERTRFILIPTPQLTSSLETQGLLLCTTNSPPPLPYPATVTSTRTRLDLAGDNSRHQNPPPATTPPSPLFSFRKQRSPGRVFLRRTCANISSNRSSRNVVYGVASSVVYGVASSVACRRSRRPIHREKAQRTFSSSPQHHYPNLVFYNGMVSLKVVACAFS